MSASAYGSGKSFGASASDWSRSAIPEAIGLGPEYDEQPKTWRGSRTATSLDPHDAQSSRSKRTVTADGPAARAGLHDCRGSIRTNRPASNGSCVNRRYFSAKSSLEHVLLVSQQNAASGRQDSSSSLSACKVSWVNETAHVGRHALPRPGARPH